MPLLPPVKWAQRKDRVILTYDLQDCRDPKIEITNDEEAHAGKVSFKGAAHSHATGPEEHAYEQDLVLYDEIDASDVKEARTDRTITLVIAKKESGEHWPRLLKGPGRASQNIKVDWDKWVDEDEEAGGADPGFDMSALQQFGGGGMGDLSSMLAGAGGSAGMAGLGEGFPEDSSDEEGEDEELPPLEQGKASE